MYYICGWASNRKGGDRKGAFGEELERMVGLVEAHVMMCIAGDFNGHVGTAETGEEESVGGFGFGTGNREGRDLVELVTRNGLAVAETFFKKRESHKISYNIIITYKILLLRQNHRETQAR